LIILKKNQFFLGRKKKFKLIIQTMLFIWRIWIHSKNYIIWKHSFIQTF